MSAQKFWLLLLALLLAGYAIAGKGFAYLGVKPVFVGEAVLLMGLLLAVAPNALRPVWRSNLTWLWIALAAFGAVKTIPYIGQYGVDALRDAAIWGYGIFAVLVAAFLARSFNIEEVVHAYERFARFLVIWLPIGFALELFASELIPKGPNSNMPLLVLKPNDISVHLAGSATFMLLRLSRRRASSEMSLTVNEVVFWCFWFTAALMVGTTSRAGLLSIIASIGLVFVLAARAQRKRFVLLLGGALFIGLAVNPAFELPNADRNVSIRQLSENLSSVWSTTSDDSLDGSREWRLQWWNEILGYTVFGDHFWTGKGYGVNLADDDGFQVTNDGSLRSPHNGHLTILARSGVPGVSLWLLLQGAFAWSLLRAHLTARRRGHNWLARVDLWVLAYWTAFMVNTTFDVFLEGPQASIWFWCIFGFGIALVQAQRYWVRQAAAEPPIGLQRLRTAAAQ